MKLRKKFLILVENKIEILVENKIPDIISLITKTDFDAKLKNVSYRVTNNKSKYILLDNEIKKLKTLVGSSAKTKFDKVQKENSFNRGFFYYLQQSYLVYECKIDIVNYIVYKLDPISSTRDTTFTIQDALFGAMETIKNADTSKCKYKGYGICFDEGGSFSIGNINNGRNILIFGADESSVMHSNNKANNIYVMDIVQ